MNPPRWSRRSDAAALALGGGIMKKCGKESWGKSIPERTFGCLPVNFRKPKCKTEQIFDSQITGALYDGGESVGHAPFLYKRHCWPLMTPNTSVVDICWRFHWPVLDAVHTRVDGVRRALTANVTSKVQTDTPHVAAACVQRIFDGF